MKVTDIIPDGYIAKWKGSPWEIKEVYDGVDFIIHFKSIEEVYSFVKTIEYKQPQNFTQDFLQPR